MSLLQERPAPTVAIMPDAPIQRIYTAEELERMPDDERVELIRGELYEMPNNSGEHGNKTMRLSIVVGYFIEEHDLGECFAAETRFVIEENPDTVLAPDFAYICKERLESISINGKLPKGYFRLAPDIIAETRSPSETKREFGLKIAQWLAAGTQVVWAVEPEAQTVTVHRTAEVPTVLTVADTLTEDTLLPGFALPLTDLFWETAQETPQP